MKFYDTFSFDIDTDLTPAEKELRRLVSEHPSAVLRTSCELAEAETLLKEALSKAGCLDFLSGFLSDTLREDCFFGAGLDVGLYRHLRYLPAILHSHDFLEIVCVTEGCCTNLIAGQQLSMRKGDICIIAPNTRHAIRAFSDECIIFNILLRTSTFEQAFFGVLSENDILSDFFMHTLYHSQSHPFLLFRTGCDQELLQCIGYAYHEFRHSRQYKNRMLHSVINAFFIVLLRNHGADVILPVLEKKEESENLVFLLKYMQEHYASVTLSELAAFFHYSERQLQRIIKNSTGMSFSENIRKLKMRQAVRLLADQDLSLTRISEMLGYADSGNFRQVFKKYYGCTPSEYRSNAPGAARLTRL